MKLLCRYENEVTGNVLSFEDFRIFSDLAGGGFAVEDGIDASMIDAGVRAEIIAKAEAIFDTPYPQVLASDFIRFYRDGNRSIFESFFFERRYMLYRFAIAEAVEGKGRFLDRIMDGVWLVCDEGGAIINEPVGGIPGNFAMMGVFEKGKGDVLFTARSSGGHASAPPKNSPVARLAAFVNEVETKNPYKKYMAPEVQAMFEHLAPYASFPLRLLFGNMWLFKPLLLQVLPLFSNQAGAMLKTTIAFTKQSGSAAFNVLPQEATVGANMRFIQHQGMEESLGIIRKIAEKYDLEMQVMDGANDYSPALDIEGEPWKRAVAAVEKTFPGLPYSPYVMTGATDAHFYQEICDCCIRFAPVVYEPEQMKGMHGVDENIKYNCLPGAVDFYKNLIG